MVTTGSVQNYLPGRALADNLENGFDFYQQGIGEINGKPGGAFYYCAHGFVVYIVKNGIGFSGH